MPLPPIDESMIPEGADPATWGRDAGAPLPPETPVEKKPDPYDENYDNTMEALNGPQPVDDTPAQKETLTDLLRTVENTPYVPPMANQDDVIGAMKAMRDSYKAEIDAMQDAMEKIKLNMQAKTALLKGCEAFLSSFDEEKPKPKPKPRTQRKRANDRAEPDGGQSEDPVVQST